MKKNSAFTLVELLIAVTIFSIVALSLYAGFNAGIKVLRRTQSVMASHQELRFFLNELSTDLRNSLRAPIHREAASALLRGGEEDGKKDEEAQYFRGDERSFTFVALKDITAADGRPRREICNITYSIKPGTTKSLQRTLTRQGRGFAAPAGGEELFLGIEDMEVLYSYEGEDDDSPPRWLKTWEVEEEIPMGVKIHFKLKNETAVNDFTKVIYIPTGVLGSEEEEGAAGVLKEL